MRVNSASASALTSVMLMLLLLLSGHNATASMLLALVETIGVSSCCMPAAKTSNKIVNSARRTLSRSQKAKVSCELNSLTYSSWQRKHSYSLLDPRPYCNKHNLHLVSTPVPLGTSKHSHWSPLIIARAVALSTCIPLGNGRPNAATCY